MTYMMKKLDLSETKRKGLMIHWKEGSTAREIEPKAVGELLLEKPTFASGLAQSWGKVQNMFLFTFHQTTGNRHAMEDGPWNFGNDLIVMENFVENKTIDEYEFLYVPIWIRVAMFR
ncbi:hypothetical protein BRADI_3g23045v3 [Brachypodium distachyon]|uniref:DUF4283 domain-containing protein n=1 Tax=Brachypodium distachyon TaxID=15368 RepID=A0A0Q3LVV3_BRADI|nr:hypothetical protein BRADI_3g23045v3 [Brachypodium distachyon]